MVLAELLRYNSVNRTTANDAEEFAGYLEPTQDGFYPGLEDGLLG